MKSGRTRTHRPLWPDEDETLFLDLWSQASGWHGGQTWYRGTGASASDGNVSAVPTVPHRLHQPFWSFKYVRKWVNKQVKHQFTPWAIKTCHFILDHNSHVSLWIFTHLVPMETGMNVCMYASLLSWRGRQLVNVEQLNNDDYNSDTNKDSCQRRYSQWRMLDSASTCQYVLPDVVGYSDFGTSWSTSRMRRWTANEKPDRQWRSSSFQCLDI